MSRSTPRYRFDELFDVGQLEPARATSLPTRQWPLRLCRPGAFGNTRHKLQSQRPHSESPGDPRARNLRGGITGRNRTAVPRRSRRPIDCFRQSNSESVLIDWIHEATDEGSGIIINPAAYSFTSIAMLDALKMFPGPIIELHISNIHRREEHYHHSCISKVAIHAMKAMAL